MDRVFQMFDILATQLATRSERVDVDTRFDKMDVRFDDLEREMRQGFRNMELIGGRVAVLEARPHAT